MTPHSYPASGQLAIFPQCPRQECAPKIPRDRRSPPHAALSHHSLRPHELELPPDGILLLQTRSNVESLTRRNKRLDAGHKPPQIVLNPAEQPYITPLGQNFSLTRVWGRGGKTNIWGRVSLRYSDLDFAGPERDSWEIPWPIRYKDIASYYDQVDQLIGVCGGDDDQDSLPGSRYFLPPPPMRYGEHLIRRAARKVGIETVPIRRAVLTQNHNGHPKCHFCGACGDGCDIGAFFNSTDYLIEPALQTGKLSVVDNAV